MSDTATDASGEAEGGAGPAIVGFHHVDLTVTDVERSVEWYGRVFGFTTLFVSPHHGASTGHVVVLEDPRSGIHIGLDHHEANEGEPFSETRTGLDHLSFHVASRDELERWAEHLSALGVRSAPIVDITGPMTLSVLSCRDPDNIQLEFFVIQ